MRNFILNRKGFTVIEVLIVLAILLIIARYVFARELYEWENDMWRSFGVPPEIPRFIIGIGVVAYFIWRVIRREKRSRLG